MSKSHPEDAVDQLRRSWTDGKPLAIEDLIREHSFDPGDASAIVDLVYAEVLLREAAGELPQERDYTERFPMLQADVMRQFQVHRALSRLEGSKHDSTQHGGRTLPDSTADEPVHLPHIPGFELLGVAGRGGTGIAYRAYDMRLRRHVAIKLLQVHSEEQQKLLLREAEAAAGLQHPGIVQVYQIGEVDGLPYLVMELMDGASMAEQLHDGPVEASRAIDILISIAEAVDFAHQQGIIHRDLKPGNVLFDADGRPRVCDFGLARRMDAEQTLQGTDNVVGTPAYMSPEQARGEATDAASDVYSLGATAYSMLTGRPPFVAANPWEVLNQVMTNDPVPPRRLSASIPPDLETVILKALQGAQHRRFPSSAEFAAELRRIRDGEPIHSRPVGPLERLWKSCRRNPLISALSGLTAAALVTVAVVSIVSRAEVSEALETAESALGQAREQRDVAVDAMNNLVLNVNTDLMKYEASVEARESVLLSAIEGMQKIIQTSGFTPDIASTLINAHCQYGFVLSQRGENARATREYLTAVSVAQNLEDSAEQLNLAMARNLLIRHYNRLADTNNALLEAEKAVALITRLHSELPDLLRARKLLATIRANYGSSLCAAERITEGIEQLSISQTLLRELHEEFPDDSAVSRLLIDVDIELSGHLFRAGNLGPAEAALDEANALIAGDNVSLQDDTQLLRKFLDCSRITAVTKFARMEFESAIEIAEKTQKHYQHLIEVEPIRPGFRLKLGVVCADLAQFCLAINDLDAAAAQCREAIRQFEEGMRLGGPEYRVQRYAIAQAQSRLADVQFRQGQLDACIASTQQIVETLDPIAEEYQLQESLEIILYRVELLQALAEQPSTADAADIERTKRVYRLWQQAASGQLSTFPESKMQTEQDIAEATRPDVKMALRVLFAHSCGLHFQHLQQAADTQPATLNDVAKETIAAIRAVRETPGAAPLFHIESPEFSAVRQTDAWSTAFRTQ